MPVPAPCQYEYPNRIQTKQAQAGCLLNRRHSADDTGLVFKQLCLTRPTG